jgi:hypothetical protein
VILAALAQHTDYDIFGVYALVEEHLQRTPTRSELVAARHAVKTLAIAGKVRAVYHPQPTIDGRQHPGLSVVRPDADIYIARCFRGAAFMALMAEVGTDLKPVDRMRLAELWDHLLTR